MFKEKGAKSIFIITAVRANINSRIAYVKTKGEFERDIIALDFEHTHIFRPSMIMGDRKENRPIEKIVMTIWTSINPFFIGKISNYKGIDSEAKSIAKAMNNAAKNQFEKVKIYTWKEMNEIL